MAEKVFAKGIRLFEKHDKAPEFVLGTLVISLDELKKWSEGDGAQYLSDYKGDKQIKMQLTKTRDGKLMLAVDTYKPNNYSNQRSETPASSEQNKEEHADDLPF